MCISIALNLSRSIQSELDLHVVFKNANPFMFPFIHLADTGGGNALNVQRTIKDLIAAGAAGCFLEA